MPHRTHPNPGRISPSTNELEQIRYALDQSAIVAITDVRGLIKYVNEKFCEISKYQRDELIGQDHRILNSGYHGPEFMRDLWHTIARGLIWRGEIRNRAKDGSLYWVDTTIVPFLEESGKPWQYLAIRYDITERKQHEQRLRDQAGLMSVGEMAAVVAHEVRNPLAGLRSGLQMLSSLSYEGGEGRDLVRDMIARLDSLNSVLSDLLTFARVRELKPTPFDLFTFVHDLASSARLDPSMKDIVVTAPENGELVISADVDQLRLVVMNLLLNAAQAMNGRGAIDVGIARRDGDAVDLTVRDFGPGVPSELRMRIFEPFFTTKHRGTGLGLPTAKRIVEAHQGELLVRDAAGGGTEVCVRLPLRSSVGD